MCGVREENLKAQPQEGAGRPQGLRRSIGAVSFGVALAFTGWLLLGILDAVPLALQFPGESTVRSHAGAAVLSFMIAAWGYWET